MKTKYIIFLLSVLFVSCEEEIEYKYNGYKDFLVLEAAIMSNGTPYCMVSLSKPVIGSKEEDYDNLPHLADAQVSISDGADTYTLSNNNYSPLYINNEIKVQPGKTYKMTVSYKGMKDAYAYVTIPSAPDCSFSVEENTSSDYMADKPSFNHMFEFTINDNPNTKDFYRINARRMIILSRTEYDETGWVTVNDTCYQDLDSYISCNDPVFKWNQISDNDIFDYEITNPACIFNDDMFNGQTKKLRFTIETSFWKGENYLFELQHITEDSYLHLRSLCYIKEYDDDFSLQPGIMHGNVENGVGAVLGWSAKTFTHVFENGREPDEPDEPYWENDDMD